MASILKGFLPVSKFTSKIDDRDDDHDEYSVEYSFAMEYSGPPVSYDIPQVVPLDVRRIPTASVFAMASMPTKLQLPVIQPIVKSVNSNKLSSQRSKLGSQLTRSLASRRHLGEVRVSSGVLACNPVEGGTDPECGFKSLDNGDECARGDSDGIESSGTLGFSDSSDESNEVSGSSDLEGSNHDKPKMSLGFSRHLQPSDPELREQGWKSPASSSDSPSGEGLDGDSVSEALSHGGEVTTAAITFSHPQSSDTDSQSSYLSSEEGPDHELEKRPVARRDVKKGLCYRCKRGTRFTEKEVCIVCGAKYCSGCLLRAMGSMPEGRKCIPCIGYPIDELRRRNLGKSSKLLKRMLSKEEIKQIMRLETACGVNQLPPYLISVNGRTLSVDDLYHLQNCRYPPKKLRPGRYWYDRVAGFWGKEGQKPCQIISAELEIGGSIERNASNGNTNVMINNREITKAELWMLQLAGTPCEGYPHFWLSADGSYLLEGQRNVMGNLWEKPRMKFICAALSLPVPPESCDEVKNEANGISSDNVDQKPVKKLLLVGCDQSGTSTIFKQAKILYDVPFSEDERQNIKMMIQCNLYRYIGIILEGREHFEEDYLQELRREVISQPGPSGYDHQIEEKNIYAMTPGLKSFSDWLLQVIMTGDLEVIFPASTREYAPRIEELVKDSGFRAAYDRRNELCALPTVANYFLDRAVEICRADYEPCDMDMLYADGITSSNGVASMEFSYPSPSQEGYMEAVDQNDPLSRYQLIRVHASSLGENCKWLEMFEDVDLVIYCVSLTDYDESCIDSNGNLVNRMLASKKLFETIITHPTFSQKDFLLVLNKFDLMEQKLEQTPLTECEWFQDFNPIFSHHQSQSGSSSSSSSSSSRSRSRSSSSNNHGSPAQRAFHYIAVQFKKVFRDMVGRKLYVTCASGLQSESVDEALKYGREILKWENEKPVTLNQGWSSESMEASTSS